MIKKTGLLVFLLCSVFLSKADSWELPTCKRYYSADSNTTVSIVPACVTVAKNKNKYFDTCSGNCLKKRPCLATVTIYKKGSRNEDSSYSLELVNLYAPHQVFISNNGVYVVTLDDWGSVGTGKNVLVIYKWGRPKFKYQVQQS